MTEEYGRVLEVSIQPSGGEVATFAASGSTSIELEDAYDFEESGGTLEINGQTVAYTGWDDDDTDTVWLSAPLAADANPGDAVYVIPRGESKWAMIDMEDDDEGVQALIPFALSDRFDDGIRDPDEQESVMVSDDSGRWEVVAADDEIPLIHARYIDTSELPGGTDGNPPAMSPQPNVIGGIGAFFLRWTPPANNDPMRFEVHVSDTPSFSPGPTTLYTETASYSATIRNLPWLDPDTGEPVPFQYLDGEDPKLYYFQIIAKDDDGPASPGAESSGSMVQITGPDIAVESVTTNHLVAYSVTGDRISAQLVTGSTISTGELDETADVPTIVGASVTMGPEGLIIQDSSNQRIVYFPLTALDSSIIRTHLIALSIEALDNFTMRGTNNQLAESARLTMSEGVVAPTTPPSVSFDYVTVQLDKMTAVGPFAPSDGYDLGVFSLNPSQIRSICWDPSYSCWVVIQAKSGGARLWRFNGDGSLKNKPSTSTPWIEDYNTWQYMSVAYSPDSGAIGWLVYNGNWWVWADSHINKIPDSWILRTDQQPILSYDAINSHWMLNQQIAGSNFHVRRFDTNGTAFGDATGIGTVNGVAGSQRNTNLIGVVYGAQTGSNRYVTLVQGATRFYVFTNTTRYNTDGAWYEWDSMDAQQAMCHDGTSFYSVDSTGKLIKYETWNWLAESRSVWLGSSAYNTGNGWETPVGGLVNVQMRRRARMTVTMGVTNDSGGADDPNKWRVYFARKVGTPIKTDLKLATTIGDPAVATSDTFTSDPSGANPPGGVQGQSGSTNTFPAGNPARLVSAREASGNPVIDLRGDGAWRMGPMTGNSSGKISNSGLACGCWETSGTGNLSTSTWTARGGFSARSGATVRGCSVTGGNTNTFNVTDAGMYLITGMISMAATSASGRRLVRINKNGGTILWQYEPSAVTTTPNRISLLFHVIVPLAAGDSFQIEGWQNTGSSLSWNGDVESNNVALQQIAV